ncbi:hypothetical protein FBULB1_2188 [Fusarium bulbicola]|nr:hypothetical protein FBULB1_2188 [Fusarium bulbicola]
MSRGGDALGDGRSNVERMRCHRWMVRSEPEVKPIEPEATPIELEVKSIEPELQRPAVEPTKAPFFADNPYIDRLPQSIVEFYLNKNTISLDALVTVPLSTRNSNATKTESQHASISDSTTTPEPRRSPSVYLL